MATATSVFMVLTFWGAQNTVAATSALRLKCRCNTTHASPASRGTRHPCDGAASQRSMPFSCIRLTAAFQMIRTASRRSSTVRSSRRCAIRQEAVARIARGGRGSRSVIGTRSGRTGPPGATGAGVTGAEDVIVALAPLEQRAVATAFALAHDDGANVLAPSETFDNRDDLTLRIFERGGGRDRALARLARSERRAGRACRRPSRAQRAAYLRETAERSPSM